ncbi:MAG: hypothetical protein NTZ10_06275 [Candidatus Saganbacteria bacterium]|nr:hypothetical protein [Candidatus Saganbacteria bacterium]
MTFLLINKDHLTAKERQKMIAAGIAGKVNNMRTSNKTGPQERTISKLLNEARSAVDGDSVFGKLPVAARKFISEKIYSSFSNELKRELQAKDR